MSRTLRLAPLLLLATLIAAACGGSGGGGSAGSPSKRASPRAGDPPAVTLHKVGQFVRPVLALAVPGTDLVAVVEQGGKVIVVPKMTCVARDNCPKAIAKAGTVVVDLSSQVSTGNEQGLLGMAFHPNWPTDPRIFLDYTDRTGATHVEAWTMTGPTTRAKHRQTLLEIPQPFANHNGGNVLFGPSGLMYIGMGDGGDAGDPGDRAQSPQELLGKLLRIDVDGGAGRGYAIPKGNVEEGAPEVWAVGLRNPWRFSFDAKTGDLWIGDVGQNKFEEIDAITSDVVEHGPTPNFEWRRKEGFAGFDSSGRTGPGHMTDPVLDYGRRDGCSVTGGVVYRGTQLPKLDGWYVFADFCSNRLRLLDASGVPGSTKRLGDRDWVETKGVAQVSSLTSVQRGDVLVTTVTGGIYQLVGAA